MGRGRNNARRIAGRRGLGVLSGVAIMAAGIAAADEDRWDVPQTLAPADIEEVRGFAQGARTLVCDQTGFVSFVWGIDDELRSRQFPEATIQYSDGLIVVTDTLEINGMTTMQSTYLAHASANTWTYSGFRGTVPVADRCTDITAELSASFVDLALAASWGMPDVARRVELFDALEDDLRTRLALAELEREAAEAATVALREEKAGLETELVTARMAVCEMATRTQGLLTRASFDGEDGAPDGFVELVAETAALGDCIDGTMLVTATGSE